MKILVVGSGGREHAIIWKLAQSRYKPELICIPGNPGISKYARCISGEVTDIQTIADFAVNNQIDLTVVGPEIPLALGIVDEFQSRGLKIFGPNKKAARLESSKIKAKKFMVRNNIPTSKFVTFCDPYDAKAFIYTAEENSFVVKADGLAAGKGVYVCRTKQQAIRAVGEILVIRKFGAAGNEIIIEQLIDGFEASCMLFFDGDSMKIMPIARDYKKLYVGDDAPNTGGMGSYAPHDLISDEVLDKIKHNIIYPTRDGLKENGVDYKGVLYFGLMIKGGEPYLLEYNVRFGDPETQAVLMLLKNDLVDVFNACVEKNLHEVHMEWYNMNAVCRIAASGGYPGEYKKGYEIEGLDILDKVVGAEIFHAGTKLVDDKVVTNGGRVCGVTLMDSNLRKALMWTEQIITEIRFQDVYYRKDIGEV